MKHLQLSSAVTQTIYQRKAFLIALAVVAAIGAGSLITLHTNANQQAKRFETVQAEQSKLQDKAIAVAEEAQAARAVEQQKAAASKAAPKAKAASDTTSTPSSISMTTVHDGKTADRPTASSKPGDLIGNNTTKKAKVYYGGPLVFSPQTVTVTCGVYGSGDVRVSTADGAAIDMPTMYWDAAGYEVHIASHSSNNYGYKPSWDLFADVMYNTQPGTYTLEMVGRTLNQKDTVEYSGKLTVIVK